MKKPPDNPEFARFTDAMRAIMKVPKTAVQAAGGPVIDSTIFCFDSK